MFSRSALKRSVTPCSPLQLDVKIPAKDSGVQFDGAIARSHRVRLVRDGRIVLEGAPLASLKRVKDDVREVKAGLECGIKIDGFDDIKPGDRIEAFEVVEVAQQL